MKQRHQLVVKAAAQISCRELAAWYGAWHRPSCIHSPYTRSARSHSPAHLATHGCTAPGVTLRDTGR